MMGLDWYYSRIVRDGAHNVPTRDEAQRDMAHGYAPQFFWA